MAIKRRLNYFSGFRVDVPHLRAIESAVSNDFDDLLRGMVTGLSQPYVIRGFEIKGYGAPGPASALQLVVADSAILHSSSSASGTVLTVPSSESDIVLVPGTYVSGSFQSNATNYVSLELVRAVDASTVDQVSGWSPSQKLEFKRTTPIGIILKYRVLIGSNGFSSNLPLYIIKTDISGNVTSITKAMPKLFRLGSGGAIPNPLHSFDFKSLINPQTGSRREYVNTTGLNPVTVNAGLTDADALRYGDFSISSLKDWMDAVMTRFKEITGSPYWYVGAGTSGKDYKISDLWVDALGTVMTGTGNLSYNMILESTVVEQGAYQSRFTDPNIEVGDAYVEGRTTLNRATVSSANNTQLVVNSLTSLAWTALEALWARRKYRPQSSKFNFETYADHALTYTIATISRTGYVVTVDTTAPHGLVAGDYIRVTGTGISGADGSYVVDSYVDTDTFTFISPVSGTDSGVIGSVEDLGFLYATVVRTDTATATNAISSWTYSGKSISLTSTAAIPANVVVGSLIKVSGLSTTGVGAEGAPNGVWEVKNINGSVIDFDAAKTVYGVVAAGGAYILAADQTRLPFVPSFPVTSWSYVGTSISVEAPNHHFTTGGAEIVVAGLGFSGAGTDAPNGTFTITSIAPDRKILFTAINTPTGVAAAGGVVEPSLYSFAATVDGAAPALYNVIDSNFEAAGTSAVVYRLGSGALPTPINGAGSITIDGVIAYAKVGDPVLVMGVVVNSGISLTVETATAHGLGTTSAGNYTIFGDVSVCDFVRYYENVQILNVDSTHFQINYLGSGTPYALLTDYTNAGSDSVYARFPNNPYPGPVQWDSDIVVKEIIGERRFTIPQTATADGTAGANRFNTGGTTGTAFLADGEVAYIQLQRNISLSSGSSYSTTGANAQVQGVAPLDSSSNPLVAGDYVRFIDESDAFWYRISATSSWIPSAEGTAITTAGFYLFTDTGIAPTLAQRPARSGAMVYSKSVYDVVTVSPHQAVPVNPDLYWIAVRRDNGSTKSRVYLKALELEMGETRQINDNEPTNLLTYTGAANEAATIPNYSRSVTGAYAATEALIVESVEPKTRTVTFEIAPELGFQIGDEFSTIIGSSTVTFTIKYLVSSRSVIVAEDTIGITPSAAAIYLRNNYIIADTDNLTVGIRKEDRELAKVNSVLNRPIYDESVFVQKMNLGGTGDISSGSFVYQGPEDAPVALAWVLHGTADVAETIEGSVVTMPGGHTSVGANACLVHIVSGTFSAAAIYQKGGASGRLFTTLVASIVKGGLSNNGIEIVLPPNRRTQQVGSSYVVWPSHSTYKASTSPELRGEELMVIGNDTIREAGVDYSETFGGPKAKIKIIRDMPVNTRLRFRNMSSYGSSVVARAGATTLQGAYDNTPSSIATGTGRPVEIYPATAPLTETVLKLTGVVSVDGGGTTSTPALGGIMPTVDGAFDVGRENSRAAQIWSQYSNIKSHGSFTGSASTTRTMAMVASNAGGERMDAAAILVPINTAIRVSMSFVARKQDNAGAAAFKLTGLFRRDTTGDVIAVSSPSTEVIGGDGEGVSYAVTLTKTQSGVTDYDQIVPVVYGMGSSVNWVVVIEFQMIGDTV